MSASIIDGKAISKAIMEELRIKIKELQKIGINPHLQVIMVGDDSASKSYIRGKEKASKKIGLSSETTFFPASITQKELLEYIQELNENPTIHGILIQLPLPSSLSEEEIILHIDPKKDVDAFHPLNSGKLITGQEDGFIPCTPAGVCELLIRSGFNPEGENVVIVGRSQIVGKPLANLLLAKQKYRNATVTVCHSRTKDLAYHTKQADILIAAMGRPQFITSDMVKEGAIIIDVGIHSIDAPEKKKGYRLVGDVDFDNVKEKVKAITPVPGGVGPMTIAMLMVNTIKAAELEKNRR